MKKTTIVQYAFKHDFDFGKLNKEYAVGEISVDTDKWMEYLNARMIYEMFHDKLIRKVKQKHMDQFRKLGVV